MKNKYCIADSASTLYKSAIPELNDDKLPIMKTDGKLNVDKEKCPLCGGSLTPMGWFRAGGLHELLCKCNTCGLAVFRDKKWLEL